MNTLVTIGSATRVEQRRNWRAQWHRFTSFAVGARPQSNRRTRRTWWREEWRDREPGEFDKK